MPWNQPLVPVELVMYKSQLCPDNRYARFINWCLASFRVGRFGEKCMIGNAIAFDQARPVLRVGTMLIVLEV